MYLFFGTFSISLTAQQPAATAPRPVFRMPSIIISPEVQADQKVTFRLNASQATQVTISGEWMPGFGASELLIRNDTGLWSVTVGPLKPELYGYVFTVDGVRMIDPNNVQVRRDGTRYESFFIVPGPESDLYMHKNDVTHGTLTKAWYSSASLGINRRLYVYTPPGYETGTQKYPVFYLLHGAGGDEDAWVTMGRTLQIMDNLIAQGKALPMIVVMTNGNAGQAGAQNDIPLPADQARMSMAEFRKYAGRFEESLVKDIIPFIDKNLRTYADKDHRAIAGLSMGGAHTQTITFNNPGLFNFIGVFSAGVMTFGLQPDELAKADQEREVKIETAGKQYYKLYWIAGGAE
jgi:enterochelin esterase family protein